MNNHNMPWTEAEDKKLMKEYKEKGRERLSIEMGRTPASLTYRYYLLKKDSTGKQKKKFKKADKCPICEGTDINVVTTYVDEKCEEVNYCLDCLHEFRSNGEIIPPLLRWDGEAAHENMF